MDPFTHDPLTIDFRSVKEPQVLSIEKADAMLNAPLSKKIVTEHNENLNLE
jgi:hypothetical protein